MTRKRYVLCGLSARAISHFVLPLTGKTGAADGNDFRDCAELSAILDIDPGRVAALNEKLGLSLNHYPAESFVEMIEKERPDVVIVAGPDDTHLAHILGALDCGCDVIAEKPMVLTADEAAAVIAKERQTGRHVTVTFNMRYKAFMTAIRRQLVNGAIGRVVNIEFNYNLDTAHGSSYFLRWNRVRSRSGGLSVHKSCHHLDVVNWWLADRPETVFAFGARNFYGSEGVHRPRSADGSALSLRETQEQCPYFRKHYASRDILDSGALVPDRGRVHLPYDVQYPPDKPAYLYDEEIDVEDTYSAVVRYHQGALLNYSINFSAAWEGLNIGINGTQGRIEGAFRNGAGEPADFLRVLPLFAEAYSVPVQKGVGSHGGADAPLQRDLFREVSRESRELGLMAGSIEGAYAVAAGAAIWRSCLSGQPVSIPVFHERIES